MSRTSPPFPFPVQFQNILWYIHNVYTAIITGNYYRQLLPAIITGNYYRQILPYIHDDIAGVTGEYPSVSLADTASNTISIDERKTMTNPHGLLAGVTARITRQILYTQSPQEIVFLP